MTGLLELREKIKQLYSKSEFILIPLLKFLFAFAVLLTLNSKLGYMTKLDNIAIVLIVALMCSFLPSSCIVLFAAMFSLLHIYALSMEAAIVGLCMYLVIFLLFFRFSPRDSLVMVLTPLLCVVKVPYVIPVAVGLVCGPASIVSVGCGIFIYYFLNTVISSAPTINAMGEEETTAKLRLVIDGILGNKAMMVMIAAFAITVLVVYLLRRMSVNHSWTIAMAAGAMTNIVILLVGDLLYDTKISVVSVLAGSVLALAVGKVIEFFRFCVDYSRTEKVQFEDDEYYYYVKAVPKMNVPLSTKTVKRINSQTRMPQPERTSQSERASQQTRVPQPERMSQQTRMPQPERTSQQMRMSQQERASRQMRMSQTERTSRQTRTVSDRSVMTERTAGGRSYGSSGMQGNRGGYRSGRSVTIDGRGGENDQDFDSEEFEDLF